MTAWKEMIIADPEVIVKKPVIAQHYRTRLRLGS